MHVTHNYDYRLGHLWVEQPYLPDNSSVRTRVSQWPGKGDIVLESRDFCLGHLIIEEDLGLKRNCPSYFVAWSEHYCNFFFRNLNVQDEFLPWSVSFDDNCLSVSGRILNTVRLFQDKGLVSLVKVGHSTFSSRHRE